MRKYDDLLLWEWFREGFEGWTREFFMLGDLEDVRELRNHLREYGVYVQRDRRRIADNLAAIFTEDEYHERTETEANEQMKISKIFHSQWNPNTDEYKIPVPRFIHTSPQQTVQQVSQQLPENNPQNPYQYLRGQDQANGQTRLSDPAIDTPPENFYQPKSTLPGGAVQQQAQGLPDVPSK